MAKTSLRILHVRLDSEIQRQLRAFASENGLTTSQATRDLLRQALGQADPVSRGWREGFAAGHAEHQRRVLGGEPAEPPADPVDRRRRAPPGWMKGRQSR